MRIDGGILCAKKIMKEFKLKVSGIVVLYCPDISAIKNIENNLRVVDKLFIVDNSPHNNEEFIINSFNNNKIEYHWLRKNYGIAKALNHGISLSIQQNFDMCFLFDQDSKISKNANVEFVKTFEKSKKTFIVTPNVVYHNLNKKKQRVKKEVVAAISSGSMIKLSYIKHIGLYLEKLFIDFVDFEYCLRTRKKGFKIIHNEKVNLIHELGNIEPKRFFNKLVYPTNHSALRKYYKTRNMLYVWKMYFTEEPKWVIKSIKKMLKEFLFVLLYETDKINKTKAYTLGIKDFIMNKYGKCLYHF